MMAKLVADVGPAAGKALVATHVDSWENGSQNWTARMREEFQSRRGYDLLPFLPVMTGRVVGQPGSLRAVPLGPAPDDLRAGRRELRRPHPRSGPPARPALHDRGLRQPVRRPPLRRAGDEPMGEFWDPSGAMETCQRHGLGGARLRQADRRRGGVHGGRPGAMARPPGHDQGPGRSGVLRGHQPLRLPPLRHAAVGDAAAPPRHDHGALGPALRAHADLVGAYARLARAIWHAASTCCARALFVADICYLQPKLPPQGFADHPRQGYGWDECSSEVVLTRMSVKNGRIVLPDGMSYRVLVLPEHGRMTPAPARARSRTWLQAGATVIGPRPLRSPSLSGYPNCDDEVRRLGEELWGDCDGKSGQGAPIRPWPRVWGSHRTICLLTSAVPPDFTSPQHLRCIHRVADGADIYFVSNPRPQCSHSHVRVPRHRQAARAMVAGHRPHRARAGLRADPTASPALCFRLDPADRCSWCSAEALRRAIPVLQWHWTASLCCPPRLCPR